MGLTETAVDVQYHNLGTSLFYFFLGTATVLAIYHYWLNTLEYVKLGNKIPGPPTVPIFGNALEAFAGSPAEMMKRVLTLAGVYNKHKIVRAWLGPKLIVALLDPDDIEVILGSNVHIEKSEEYKLFQPWLGEGLLISKGEKWKSHRKMIAPTFHASILKTFVPVFNKNSFQLINKLRKEIGNEFDVHDYMSGITVDILLETAMGVKRSEKDSTGFDYAMAVMDMCNILHQRHYKFWLRSDILFNFTQMAKNQMKFLNIIHSLTRKVIKEKKTEYYDRKEQGVQSLYNEAVKNTYDNKIDIQTKTEKISGYNNGTAIRDDLDENDENDIGEKKRLAFLDFMIEASHAKGNNLTDEEIKEEVDTIMFEGHDTTAAGSSFVLCMLGVHQNFQEKVVQELNDIFEGSDRPVTFADTLEMKYLERVIMETLRMYPPVPMIARKVNEDVSLPSGYIIPKGTTTIIGTYMLHRSEDHYDKPNVFNPDNFLPEKCQERHYYSFIPFSAGPRSCVGRKYAMLKLKVILANILRNFKVTSTVPEEEFKLQGDIILKRTDGFRIKLEERNI